MKLLLTWLVPGALVLGITLALAVGLGPDGFADRLGSVHTWVVFGVAILLGAFFHRSRVVFFVFGLAALFLVHSQGGGDQTGFLWVGGLLAVTMCVLSFSQDRGVLSTGGLLQLFFLLVFFFLGLLLLELAPGDFASLLEVMPVPPRVSEWSGLPQPIFLAFTVSVLATFLAAIFREGPVERGILWGLLSVALALRFSDDPGAVALLLTGAGITVGLSVLETSYAMAFRDDLTGLPGRRALMVDLQGVGNEYATAMVDVDHFKRFNDRYGHDVGDQVLRMVAARLAEAKGRGKVYRYGGEEFTLLFPGKSVPDVLPRVKEIRRVVEDATFTLRSWRRPRRRPVDPGAWRGGGKSKPRLLSVTVSIGVADSSGGDSSPEAVLKKADQALYRAKSGGRNRVAK